MSRVIACPHCQKKLSIKGDSPGRRLACPQCKGTFETPAAASEESAPAPETDFFAGLGTDGGGSTGAKKTSSAAPTPRTPVRPVRPKVKANSINPLLGVYIAGGVATIVIVAVLIGMMSSGGTRKPQNIKWGLKERQRLHIFQEAIEAVDNFGMGDMCKREWKRIESDAGIDDNVLKQILEEGFAAKNWELPSFANFDATKKSHRMEWIKKRNETHREPIL